MLVCVLNTLCGRYGRAGDAVNHAGVLGTAYQPREGALPPREFWGYLEQPRVRGLRTLNWEQPSAALCDEILTPGDGQVRALICNGGNPAVAFPDQEKVVRALRSLDLLVCLDVRLGPTPQLADYVFGCKLSLEKPDYTRHLEWYFPVPFAQYTPAILEAEGDVIDEWELFWGLAHRMRVPLELGRAPLGPPVADPRAVDIDVKPTTDELMEIEAADARVPLAEVKRTSERARVRGGAHDDRPPPPRRPRGSTSPRRSSSTTSRRWPRNPCVDGGGYRVGEHYTHRLASRRLRQVFNSTGVHLAGLNRRGPGNPAYLSPADMAAAGLADGDLVEIVSEHGSIVGVARTDDCLLPGVVSMAHAWGALPGDDDLAAHPEAGACTNRLVANDSRLRTAHRPVPAERHPREPAARAPGRPRGALVMIDWEPHAEEFRLNPYPLYRQLRDEMPLYHNEERGFYALTRFDDCWNALVDTKRFSSADGVSLEKYEVGQKLMILMDPPRHTWHRKVMSHMFTPRVIANLEPGIRATCVQLLDDLRDRDEFDVVEDFSMLLPLSVIAELIGLPDEYRLTAKRLSHLTAQRVSSNAAPEAAIAASLELNDYLLEETKRRRRHLGDDLISTIMTTPMIDDTGAEHYLDDEQIAAFFFEFTFAGNDTTTRSIANGVVGLAWYPDQRRELVDDLTLVPNGVEELVRWDTPSHYLGRTTTEDVELPYGTIPAGSTVAVVLASANHDERMYEEPELLDIRRHFDRKLAFGIGPHVCIGAALARLELRIAFEEFLRRFRDFHVADTGCVQDMSGQNRGLFHLPLVIDRATHHGRRVVVPGQVRRTTSTVPAVPSMRMVSPVRSRLVPTTVLITHGTPSSRATIAPWLIGPPTSMTSAAATRKWPTQLGSVAAHTRISPGSSGSLVAGSSTTRATPSTTPGLTPSPSMTPVAWSSEPVGGGSASASPRTSPGGRRSRTPPPGPCGTRPARGDRVPRSVTNSAARRWNTSSGSSSRPRSARERPIVRAAARATSSERCETTFTCSRRTVKRRASAIACTAASRASPRERIEQLPFGVDAVCTRARPVASGPSGFRHRRHRVEQRPQQARVLPPHGGVEVGGPVALVAVFVEELLHRDVAVGERPHRRRHLVVVGVAVPAVEAREQLGPARGRDRPSATRRTPRPRTW